MELHALVKAFNNLSRSPKTPSGQVDNHWQFAVHHVALAPPGDLLHLINPGSFLTHTEGPAQIFIRPSTATQADLILPLLLRPFVTSMGASSDDSQVAPFAPWSWGTSDKNLAKALEERLISAGVRRELCNILVGDEKMIAIEQDGWLKLLSKTTQSDNLRCRNCDQTGTLQHCARCAEARYCSRACQRADWINHKPQCSQPSSWTAEAQALGSELGLTLPPSGHWGGGLR